MNQSHRRRRLPQLVALGALATLALVACGNTSPTTSGGSVNVALDTSLSGSFGFFGLANQNAAKLTIEQINQGGGLLGKQVNLQVKDDGGAPNVASDLVRTQVLNDHIVALFGGVSSSVALAEQTLVAKYKIPFIVHTSNTDKLTVDKFNNYTFSVVPNTGMEGRANAMAAVADCVVITTDHTNFSYVDVLAKAKLIVDTRNALKGVVSDKVVRLYLLRRLLKKSPYLLSR